MNNRMNVQAYLNNVSFPKNMEELDHYADQFDVEVLMCSEWVEWTVPKWTVPGDIVLFFHAKTAIQSIRRLETALKKEKEHLSQREYERLWNALQRARLLYQKYGGKILAIGKVAEQPFYDAHPGMSEEEKLQLNINFITNRRIFAKIDEICLLPCPVDISEFSDFIFVSGGFMWTIFCVCWEIRKSSFQNVRVIGMINVPGLPIMQSNWVENGALWR